MSCITCEHRRAPSPLQRRQYRQQWERCLLHRIEEERGLVDRLIEVEWGLADWLVAVGSVVHFRENRGREQYHCQRNYACSHSPRASCIRAPSVDVGKNRTETFSLVPCLTIRRQDQRCHSNQRTSLAILNSKTFRRCPWTSSKVVKAEFHSHERDPPPSSSGTFLSFPVPAKCNRPQRYRRLIG